MLKRIRKPKHKYTREILRALLLSDATAVAQLLLELVVTPNL